jgi:hypothetical protein
MDITRSMIVVRSGGVYNRHKLGNGRLEKRKDIIPIIIILVYIWRNSRNCHNKEYTGLIALHFEVAEVNHDIVVVSNSLTLVHILVCVPKLWCTSLVSIDCYVCLAGLHTALLELASRPKSWKLAVIRLRDLTVAFIWILVEEVTIQARYSISINFLR